jgi:ankyrin repeat protein
VAFASVPAVTAPGFGNAFPLLTMSTSRKILFLALALLSSIRAYAMDEVKHFSTRPENEFMDAVAAGDTVKLEKLHLAGADVNMRASDGMTPTLWAVAHQSKAGLTYLLDHGANPNVQTELEGYSATSFSAMVPDPWYLKEVLAHGGDVNLLNPHNGQTPIYESILTVQLPNSKILIDSGAQLNMLDQRNHTPAYLACIAQQFQVVYEMLVAGADPTTKVFGGSTLLRCIKQSTILPSAPQYAWKLKVIDLLRSRGLDIQSP